MQTIMNNYIKLGSNNQGRTAATHLERKDGRSAGDAQRETELSARGLHRQPQARQWYPCC
jgi:hypothetical protein